MDIKRKPTRRDLLKVLAELQGLIGEAMGAHDNDRDPDARLKVRQPLEKEKTMKKGTAPTEFECDHTCTPAERIAQFKAEVAKLEAAEVAFGDVPKEAEREVFDRAWRQVEDARTMVAAVAKLLIRYGVIR